MKCVLYFLLAFVAALTVAAPRASAHREIEPSSSVYEGGGAIVHADNAEYVTDEEDGDANHSHNVADYLAKLHNLTATSSLTASSWNVSNLTASGMETAGVLPGKYAVALRLGHELQHVGTLRKHRLSNEIYRCLKEVDGIRGTGKPPSNYCKDTDSSEHCWPYCRIENIIWDGNAGGTPKYSHGAYLRVRTWWPTYHEWDNPPNKQLRDIAYRLVASIYRTMADQAENCYLVNFPGTRATKFCNIGKQVLVAFPTNGGTVQTVVKADVRFNGFSKVGSYHCDKAVGPVKELFRSDYRSQVSTATGWQADKIIPQVFCADDACLDWYNADKNGPWVENPACKLPNFGD
ncbi:hypothetical protein BKA66DRAFT_613136 [Pyrenochaeta sp. MPI-SDFR-AT-0127]|nr:hypothetical protein BKA66DRAFT_613136 [Pyrenochaeta sp. MPI-SDFR-AT-0127]